eukprot:m.239502 g.239502  ORF g.239502 m.239502 type:complete len:331 (-) comp22612_c0_seq1:97-1089(-)
MASSLESHKRALQDATNRDDYLLKLKATIRDTDGSVESQLGLTTEQFAKQKFNFIELETKQFFHEHIMRENTEDAAPNEAEAAKIKEHKKTVKNRRREMEKMIDETIAVAVATREQLQGECNEYAQALAELEKLEEEFASLSSEHAAQTAEIGSELTGPALQAATTALELKLAGIESSRGKQDATARGLEAQVADMQRELDAVTQANCLTRGQVSSAVGAQAMEDAKMLEYHTWYLSVSTMLAQLSGLRVLDSSPDRIVFEYSELAVRAPVCVLHLRAGRLVSAEMPTSAPELASICHTAVATNDIPFLVRETRKALKAAIARRQEQKEN